MASFLKSLSHGVIGAAKLLTGAVLLLPLVGANAFAEPIIASATRTQFFSSTSTASVVVPLRDNGSTSLQFDTNVANQPVVIIYNAECTVAAPRGTRLNLRILVDGAEAEPVAGTDFALCSAIDTGGQTWASVVRQSVLKVPATGNHTVKVLARMLGGSGSWVLDDSSLVVQPALATFATRTDAFQSTSTSEVPLPLTQSNATVLNFPTAVANQLIKITYNAECSVTPGIAQFRNLRVKIVLDGKFLSDYNLCSGIDSSGMTWDGAAHQLAITIPTAGTHSARVIGELSSSPGTWRVDDSSLVVTKNLLASATYVGPFASSSITEIAVPILPAGGTALPFTTSKDNQLVKLTYNAVCGVEAARGRWLGMRVVVDNVEAAPASGFDFVLCSAVAPDHYYEDSRYRQSIITVPKAGVHKVRVLARASDYYTSWSLAQSSLTVE